MSELPPCGLYRTLKPVAGIDAGRLVYFHNHGNPGPGLYFPEGWNANRARFSENGATVPPDFDPKALKPLPAEGFYRVKSQFHCCDKKCMQFEPEQLVQLGYNGAGKAIVFIPEIGGNGLSVPDRGTFVDDNVLSNMVQLKLPQSKEDPGLSLPRGMIVH